MPIDWNPKILGLMQSSADKTLQIAFSYSDNNVTITGKTMSEPYVMDKEVFAKLTVHLILETIGVEINDNAGK
jgi:hypothetical protein